MKLFEMCERYDFHDSLFEKIEYDEIGKIVTIKIDFCNWAQSFYTADMPETETVELTFSNAIKVDGGIDEIRIFAENVEFDNHLSYFCQIERQGGRVAEIAARNTRTPPLVRRGA